MCNPSTTMPAIEKPTQPPLTHVFLDIFVSLPAAKQESPGPEEATTSDFVAEAKSLFALILPIALATLILCSHSILSMLLLGRLGDTEHAAGSLTIAFANITGYSVLFGLCSQALAACCPKLRLVNLHCSVTYEEGLSMELAVEMAEADVGAAGGQWR